MSSNLESIIKKEEETVNLVKRINETKKEILEQTKQNINVIWEVILTLIFALFTLVILGLTSLFDQGWDWKRFQSAEFWQNYFLIQSATWFSRVWILVIKNKINSRKNTEYIKSKNNIQTYIDKDFAKPFINENVTVADKNRKIRAWKNKQKLKILKISKKHRVENILNAIDLPLNLDEEAFLIKTRIKTQPNKENPLFVIKWFYWFRKRHVEKVQYKLNALLRTIQDDYISKNLDNLKVKYNKITRSTVTSGHTPKRDRNDLGYSFKENTVSAFLNATLPTFLLVSVFMFLILPLTGQMNKDADSWYRFTINVFLVFISAGMMWYTADELFVRTKLRVIREREDTLKTFYNNTIKNIKIEDESYN